MDVLTETICVGFNGSVAAVGSRMELWCSSFGDAHCLFK